MPKAHSLDGFTDRLLGTGLHVIATEVGNNPWQLMVSEGARHFLVRFVEPFVPGELPKTVVFYLSTLSGIAPSVGGMLTHLGMLAHTFEGRDSLEEWARGVGLDPGEEATGISYAWGKTLVEDLKFLGTCFYKELLDVVG